MGVSMRYVKIIGGGLVVAALVVAVVILAIEVARLSNEDENQNKTPWDSEYRLPDGLSPNHYDILIHPDLVDDTFSGTMSLTFTLLNSSLSFVPIHQKGLNISNPVLEKLINPGLEGLEIADSFHAPINDFYIVLPKTELLPAVYKVTVDFSGSLKQPELVGIYSSQYSTETGAKRKMVTSKFEPTYARRAFPCLDEPDKKATFAISLVHPKGAGWSALSNMNANSTIDGPGTGEATTIFKTSVKMSTYLACFIVSEFKNLADTVTNSNGTTFPVRTFAPAHLVKNTQFSLDAAVNITDYYIKYFKIDYPLPKLDLIAIPDFVSGAMEHWGLVTFRETNMLVDAKESSVANSQQVGMVVAHELAHMWFGNLVTMRWWDDLWLNEGFASYIEYKGLAHFQPDWRLLDQFLTMDLQPVMVLDAQLSSHPIIQPVAHPDQITELFDTITYSKGSSVIRMLEGILGEPVFQDGVSSYLKKFAYDNAETRDLWSSLSEAAQAAGQNVNVSKVMDTWTLQMGLPVVEVKYNPVTKNATVTQKRFFGSPAAEKKAQSLKETSPFSYRWEIPLTYVTDLKNEQQKAWFPMENAAVEITVEGDNLKWIKFNHEQIGFYRVNYEPAMWESLKTAAESKKLSAGTDRSSLLDDVFSLADGGYLEYNQALEFALYLVKEDDYIAWSTASTKMLKLVPLLKNRPAFSNFKAYTEFLVKTQYEASTWVEEATDSHITKRLRSTILNLACSCDYEVCLKATTIPFRDFVEKGTKPGPNTRQLVYNFGMKRSGDTNGYWDKVWDLYLAEKDPQEKLKLMVSLSYVKDKAILNNFIRLAENETNVRGQDYFTVLQSISDNDIGQSVVWDYVRSNWEALVERFTLNSRNLGRLIPRITQNFDTKIQLDELNAFFAKYPEAGAGAVARKQAIERVEANILWVELYYAKIEAWLKTWATPVPKK